MSGTGFQMIRRIRKGGLFTGINLLGLALGLASCFFLGLYVFDELMVDRFHERYDRIALVQQYEQSPTTGGKLATDFSQKFSQVEKSVRLVQSNPLLGTAASAYYEPYFYFADSSVFDVFSFKLIEGNPRSALKEQAGVVLTKTAALKYFPAGGAMGKTIRYDNKTDLRVTGIMEDLPANAHLKISCLASMNSANALVGYDVTGNYWGGSAWTYLLLKKGAKPSSIEIQFPAYLSSLNDPNASAVWKLRLIPLKDLYLRTSFIAPSPITYVYILSLIGLFILSLACFNYINLATATSMNKAKETGVRKVLGASVFKLRRSYLLETAVLIFLALLLALSLVALLLPAFNQVSGKQLGLAPLFSIPGLLVMTGLLLMLTLLAGFYPAIVLSAFQPSTVLKGQILGVRHRHWLSKGLLTMQFMVSLAMVVATVVVYRQMYFVQHMDAGYQRSQVLTIDLRDASPEKKELFRQEVKRMSSVASASLSFSLPGSGILQGQKLVQEFVPQQAATASIRMQTVDEDYLQTYQISLLEGRMLSTTRVADKQAFLINETAKKYFGWDDIAGKKTGYYRFQYRPDGTYEEIPFTGEVVGVVKDYHHDNLKAPIEPMIFALNSGFEGQLAVRLKSGSFEAGISQVGERWKTIFPERPFEFAFLDTIFDQSYRTDQRTGKVFGIFAVLAIFISCLGLFGLVTHQAIERRKEIGIRRVLGADVSEILGLFSREFIALLFVAALLSFPIAWYGMSQWLNHYAYRIDISWWIFPLALAVMATLALTTVATQALRAALQNPVNAIRTDA